MSAKEEGIDIMHHLLDGDTIEIFNYHIDLRPLHLELWGYDISITKHVIMMWIVAAAMLIIFPIICNRKSLVPTGIRNFFEAILLFIRDDIVRPNMPHEEEAKYLPYLWTLFFFIWFCNLLGLMPFGSTATGNISVTVALALVSFFFIQFSGIRKNGLWHHLVSIVPPVPLLLWPLLAFVEIIGIFIKPGVLAVRLFANMISGHIVLMVMLGFIFIFKNPFVTGLSVVVSGMLFLLELFIALLQAYVFTFLTAIFMGMTIHPEH